MAEPTSSSLTLRFKHGYTTTLLYTESLTPLSTIIETLLTTLRERYILGLPIPTSKPAPPSISPTLSRPASKSQKRVHIPAKVTDVKIAVFVDQYDAAKGWKELELSGDRLKDTPRSLGLKDGTAVAFRFVAPDTDAEDIEEGDFEVVWPTYDETYPEEMGPAEEMGTADEEGEERGSKLMREKKRKRGMDWTEDEE